MVGVLGNFFVSIFGNHPGIATVIISMFPLIELKGGIPVGMSEVFWGENVLNGTQSFLFAMLGSCLVVPIIALIFKPIVNWLKSTRLFRKIGDMIDNKVKNHSQSINEKTKDEKSATKKVWAKVLFIFGFVAVPLPLTGVWTGTCVAVAIGLNFWQTVLSCVLGNMVAGLIIVTVCVVFPQFTTILFLVFIVFILIVIVWTIVKNIINNKKNNCDIDTSNSQTNESSQTNMYSSLNTEEKLQKKVDEKQTPLLANKDDLEIKRNSNVPNKNNGQINKNIQKSNKTKVTRIKQNKIDNK